jgi:hypothetical protein
MRSPKLEPVLIHSGSELACLREHDSVDGPAIDVHRPIAFAASTYRPSMRQRPQDDGEYFVQPHHGLPSAGLASGV